MEMELLNRQEELEAVELMKAVALSLEIEEERIQKLALAATAARITPSDGISRGEYLVHGAAGAGAGAGAGVGVEGADQYDDLGKDAKGNSSGSGSGSGTAAGGGGGGRAAGGAMGYAADAKDGSTAEQVSVLVLYCQSTVLFAFLDAYTTRTSPLLLTSTQL